MPIESICIHIAKTAHRAKALVELPNYNISYVLYIIALRHWGTKMITTRGPVSSSADVWVHLLLTCGGN